MSRNVVVIKDYSFMPKDMTVKVGDTVYWSNQDKVSHTLSATDNSFSTGTIFEGGEGSYTFTSPGMFTYYSKTYPNVRGTITVE